MTRSWWCGGAEGSRLRRRRPSARPRVGRMVPLLELLEGRDLPSFVTAPAYPAGPQAHAVAVAGLHGDRPAHLGVGNKPSAGPVGATAPRSTTPPAPSRRT